MVVELLPRAASSGAALACLALGWYVLPFQGIAGRRPELRFRLFRPTEESSRSCFKDKIEKGGWGRAEGAAPVNDQ